VLFGGKWHANQVEGSFRLRPILAPMGKVAKVWSILFVGQQGYWEKEKEDVVS